MKKANAINNEPEKQPISAEVYEAAFIKCRSQALALEEIPISERTHGENLFLTNFYQLQNFVFTRLSYSEMILKYDRLVNQSFSLLGVDLENFELVQEFETGN